ncbi:hypothetical protein [Cellulophaga sp. L1A9]|uniref:hypothetical protein n=1 Tax=Cellulophaga sp. L1A9 TaxID=2686362 RepID=UPI00131A99E6|nr:hypothetical protein [Cellulophaga sp. L1A9]
MKKIIILLTIFFTVTLTAKAQEGYPQHVVKHATKYVEFVASNIKVTPEEKTKLLELKLEQSSTAFKAGQELKGDDEAIAAKRVESWDEFRKKVNETFGKKRGAELNKAGIQNKK